jgi:2-C-methyl-D-erythritol 2,4-cyclodiphosphate synthase
MIRVGQGYDIHRTKPGKGLKLGGVAFPKAGFTLDGHSDADVICHAVCDALLGAAGLPDIGRLFPNTDPAHRLRNSLEFLTGVAHKLQVQGATILNIDCTLIAEAPKVAEHAPLMCSRMAKALGIKSNQLSVKATTNEGCGFIGRQEGLAALAVALLEIHP